MGILNHKSNIIMADHRTEEEIAKILMWKKSKKASNLETSARFGVSRNSVSNWMKKYDVDQLAKRYRVIQEIENEEGIKNERIERVVPAEVEILAGDITESLLSLSTKGTLLLSKWLDKKLKQIDNPELYGAMNETDINKTIKVVQAVTPYVVAPKSNETNEPPTVSGLKQFQQVRDMVMQQIERSNQKKLN